MKHTHGPSSGRSRVPAWFPRGASLLRDPSLNKGTAFSDAERDHIHAGLLRHFALDFDTARQLMDFAEQQRRNAVDIFQFANLVRTSYDTGQKTLLAEIMWGLILTDGEIARHESYILRKIANLLDLEPGYLSQAKAAAAAKITGAS